MEVFSLSFLGLFLFPTQPTLFPVEDPAVADLFFKGETKMVDYLVHRLGLPLEEKVRHSRVLHQEEGGEEEEAQEGKADNLRPASQPGSASQWSVG